MLHRPWFPVLLYIPLAVLVSLIVIPTWGWTYWDFGDGNYMYIARRVREGVVLYDQILAPQPPLHTWSGMAAQAAAEAAGISALIGTRIFCLAVRLLAGLAVLLLAQRYFGCPFRAIVAAAIYLFLPIGFWWSLGYQSENLENVFLVAALYFLIPWTARGAALAGVLGALACHCNMTGVCYAFANTVFLAFRRPKLLIPYLGAFASVYVSVALLADFLTNGAFISNVLLNQVGTFPRTDILQSANPDDSFWKYAYRKITNEGSKVLDLEGGFILAALGGLVFVLTRRTEPENVDRRHRDEFLAWTFVGQMLSICFTAKGGTVNYIFTLGEPGVALFAAHGLVTFWRAALPHEPGAWKSLTIHDTRLFLRLLFPLAVTGLIVMPGVRNIRLTLAEAQAELPADEVLKVRAFIETYAKPGDTILAPPFYAFLTRTNVAGEIAENYIWNIKFMNESFDGKPADATAKMQEIAQLIQDQKVAVVLLDMAQTGQVSVIQQALADKYQPAELLPNGQPLIYQTRNTRLGLYIPKTVNAHHPPLAVQ